MATFRTIADSIRFRPDPVKGSRFIATAAPIDSEEEAQQFIASIKAEMPDATHHCWSWLLNGLDQSRSSDDGEPGGSAGRPILAQIHGHQLTNIVVVVTRYFGGTKLGVGGLIRAYGGAAGMALDRAQIVEVRETTELTIQFDYADTKGVERNLTGLAVADTDYGELVTMTIHVPLEDLPEVKRLLANATSGRIEFLGEGERR